MHVDYVFLNVCFFLWFEEISVVFEVKKKSHRKGVRIKLRDIYIFMAVDGC